MTPRRARHSDLFGDRDDQRELAGTACEWGTVGFDSDQSQDEVLEKGDGSNGPDGVSLLHVTLFKGRDITRRPVQGKAQGRPVKVQLQVPFTWVPPLGMRVVVLFPGSDMDTPGNGILLCGAAPAPQDQFDATRSRIDVGLGMFLTIAADGLTLKDHGDSGASPRFPCIFSLGISPAGGDPTINCNDPTGSGFTIAKGVVGLYATDGASPPAVKAALELAGPMAETPGVTLAYNGAAIVTWDDAGNGSLGFSKSLALVAPQVLIGAGATPMTPALWGPGGPAAVPSTSVFISK